MTSFMQRQFVPYAMLFRVGGCFFIKNFWKPLENARVTWTSLYVGYSASLVGVCFGCEIMYIVQGSHLFNNISYALYPCLLLVARAMVNLKLLCNVLTMATGSIRLLEFFRKASIFEKATRFSPVRRGFWFFFANHWSVMRQLLLVISLTSNGVISIVAFVFEVTNLLPDTFRFIGGLSAAFLSICYLLYDVLPYIVLRSCSAVLRYYLQAQLKLFESCCEVKAVRAEKHLSRQLEAIRHNLGMIRDLKDSLNAIWQVPLAAMSATVLFVVCVVCYAVFHDGFYGQEFMLALSYCVYAAFAFMDMACVSQALSDEAQRFKNATKMAFAFEVADGHVQQLRYLHEAIDPDGMCLSGGGFFKLNKSLLVSMAGTFITYTVILSQTGQELRNKAASGNSTQSN